MFSSEVYSAMRKLFQLFSTKTLRIQEHVSLFTACLLLVSPHPKPLKSGEKPETCTIPQSLHFFPLQICFQLVAIGLKEYNGNWLISNASWTIKILGDFGAHNAWHHTCESGPAKRGGGEIPGKSRYLVEGMGVVFFWYIFCLKWPVLNIDFDGFGNTCSPQIFRCVCWRGVFFCGLSFKISLFQQNKEVDFCISFSYGHGQVKPSWRGWFLDWRANLVRFLGYSTY